MQNIQERAQNSTHTHMRNKVSLVDNKYILNQRKTIKQTNRLAMLVVKKKEEKDKCTHLEARHRVFRTPDL